MADKPRIVSATISAMPETMFDPMPTVSAKFDDGAELELFEYYPDEISFTAEEFVGLTLSEATALRQQKDKAYIQS